VWDLEKGVQVFHLTGHSCAVAGMTFSPDGRRLLTASNDPHLYGKKGEIIVWDLETGQEILTLKEFADGVPCLALSRDGHQLASGGRDGLVKIWDARPPSEDDRSQLEMHFSRREAEVNAAHRKLTDRNAWEPWSKKGFVHFHRGEWDRAIADFSRAIELAP